MPAAYTIDAPLRLVLSRGWGVLTATDLLGHARALVADGRFEPSFRQLAGLREVTDLDFPSSAIAELARLSPFAAGAPRAIVVGTDVMFGMARMYQILREPIPDSFHIFRHMEPAVEWLGLTANETAVMQGLSQVRPLPHWAADVTGGVTSQ